MKLGCTEAFNEDSIVDWSGILIVDTSDFVDRSFEDELECMESLEDNSDDN